MKKVSRYNKILVLIIFIAVFLRLWGLGQVDVITDEGLNGFRSIGYIDFFLSEFQKTPYDWLGASDLPAWTKLSFHDHPPLTFMIQNVFFKLGGANLWSLRLPFVLAGIGSIYLIYLIGRKLFEGSKILNRVQDDVILNSEMTTGTRIGLIAAGLLAINSYHVWVSRIGLQESIVIFLNLLTVYLFLKALEKPKLFIWVGVAFGLSMLAKYTSIVLLPIFIIYLLILKREIFRSKYLYYAGAISLIVFSPVIIYNLKLYQSFGHFDFQLSYFLGQEVSDWQFRLGRLQAGSLIDKIKNLFPAIWHGVTPVFGTLTIASLLALIYSYFKNSFDKKIAIFLGLGIVFHLLLFLAVGPRERFVAMVVPWLVLVVAFTLSKLLSTQPKYKLITHALLAGFVVYEIFFAVNTALVPNKLGGREGVSYSNLKHESLNWGFNELGDYLEKDVFSDQYPAFQFPTRYKFLEDIKQVSINKAKAQGRTSAKVLLIYDENIHSSATIWYIFKPFVYQGWPFVSSGTYLNIIENEGADFFRQQGIERFVFIKATENTLLRPEDELVGVSEELEQTLVDIQPGIITNPRVGEAFRIYEF